jgi:hypothetical protein
MDISTTLQSKRVALDRALAEVRALKEQIAYWENAEAMSKKVSVFERITAAEQPTSLAVSVLKSAIDGEVTLPIKPNDLFASPRLRNKKGSVRSAILSALNPASDTSLDDIEAAIKAQVNSPVTRASLRTQMMNLKNDGTVTSTANGVFRLAPKGENPAATGFSSASESQDS